MVLLGQLPEGLADVVGPGAARNAEDLVGISRHGSHLSREELLAGS
jgi:hypothetical protein